MKRATAACAIVLAFATSAAVRAQIGEPVSAALTRVQSSKQFANVPSVHGSLPGSRLQRWKFTTANLEQRIFAVDGRGYADPVVRQTYIRITHLNPYSLRAGQEIGEPDLSDVLALAEYRDFERAAAVETIHETPLHLIAYFYRGNHAVYEVIEPAKRQYGTPDRFEWRSFSLSELPAAMKAARACDNGSDCAAW